MQRTFDESAVRISSRTDLSAQQKLRLYALFKQVREPDARSADPPSRMKVKERAKWEAWTEVSDRSPEQAMSEYVALVSSIVGDGAAAGPSGGPSKVGATRARVGSGGSGSGSPRLREVREDMDQLVKVFAKSKTLAPHIPKLIKHKRTLRPHLPLLTPHLDLLAPLLPRMLDWMHVLGPYMGDIAAELPVLLPYLSQLLDELPHIQRHVPLLMENRAAARSKWPSWWGLSWPPAAP